MKWTQGGPLLTALVLAACTKPQAPPSVVPFSLGCQVVRGVEWIQSVAPSKTPESALDDIAEQTGLAELPRSGWTLLSDDGAGRRV